MLNGQRLVADKAEATRVMLAVAGGKLPESDFAEWIKAHMKRRI